jgi:hypothetical protein
MSNSDALPLLPHLTSEFYVWLWWASEAQESLFSIAGDVGPVELWVDERLAFRTPNTTKVVAVMTGESPSTSLEARAALAGGKVLQDIRLGIRRDDREFFVTLKGAGIDLQALKLPQVMSETPDEAVFDRMFLYDELCFILRGLFQVFSELRASGEWTSQVLPEIHRWVMGEG